MEQSTVVDLQQLPAWAESSPRWCAHQQGPRGLCWTVSTARMKPRLPDGRDFLQGEPWVALDPQPYLLLEMCGFEMLSPESLKAFFLCDSFFSSSSLFLRVQNRKFAAQAWRRLKNLFSDLLPHDIVVYIYKKNTFSWASWHSLEYKQHSEPSVCWIQLSFLTVNSQNLLQHTGVPRCDTGMVLCSLAALSSCSAGPLPKGHCAGSCQHAWSGPQSAAPRFSLFTGLIFALVFL